MEPSINLNNIVKNIPGWDSPLSIAPRTKEQFASWINAFFNFKIPWDWEKRCKTHSYPLDAMWDAYSEQTQFSIWYANRSGGKTYDLSVLSHVETLFKPNCGINVVGGSLEQSQKTIAYLSDFWQNEKAPKHMLINKEVAGRGYKLTNGSWVRALAASSKSVRGSHQPKLRIDECDELDEKVYQAALGQPKSMYGIPENVIVSSTLHVPFGLMSEIIDKRHETKAKLYQWCIEEVKEPHGFWTNEEIETKKRQITKAMWKSEFLCLRPKLGESIFDFESVERAYRRGLLERYIPKIQTEAGIDWGHTCTVLNIIQNCKEYFNVPISKSWEYWELTDRCNEIAEMCIEYKISVIYCDSNPKDATITLRKILKKKRATWVQVVPIAFNKWKTTAIDVVRFLLERDLINIKDKVLQDKLKKFHYKNVEQEIIAKEDDHYPDALIAWAASRTSILGKVC